MQLFCLPCIWHWLNGATTCPSCRAHMSTSLLVAPHPFAAKAFAAMEIHCDFHESPLLGCRANIPLQSLQTHVRDCPYNPDTDVSPLPTVVTESFTVKEILACPSQHLKGSTSLELLGHVVGSMSVDGC